MKEIAQATERQYAATAAIIARKKIPPAETHGRMKFYDDSVAGKIGKGKQKLTENQKAENHRKASRDYMGKKRAVSYYKVSVKDELCRWIVKACSLTRSKAYEIAHELDALGVEARVKPHSYGIGK